MALQGTVSLSATSSQVQALLGLDVPQDRTHKDRWTMFNVSVA